MLEGALVSLVFLVTLFGLMDFGRMVWSFTLISHAAREATRYAIVHGSSGGHTASTDDIKTIVKNNVIGLDTSNISTAVTFTPDQSAGSTAKVVVSYTFSSLAPYVTPTVSMKSTSQMVIYQ